MLLLRVLVLLVVLVLVPAPYQNPESMRNQRESMKIYEHL